MRIIACSVVVAVGLGCIGASPAGAQAQPPAPAPGGQPGISSQELYHVHVVKSAPGKMSELIAAYRQAPVAPDEPGPPVILRHLQGDDWDLLVLTPLGKEETIRPTDTPEVQKSVQQMRPLRTQHGDTFTAGPPWRDVQTILTGSAPRPTGTSGSAADSPGSSTAAMPPDGTIYTVTTYRALPGHRDQLGDTLRRIVGLHPDRRTMMQHVEGAPWEFIVISRYDSWKALGDDEVTPPDRLRAQGFANDEAIGLELRQHAAEHRDTIARMVR